MSAWADLKLRSSHLSFSFYKIAMATELELVLLWLGVDGCGFGGIQGHPQAIVP